MQSDAELIAHLNENEQMLMIVNNRRHAHVLFDGIKHLAGARHLTTLMCAKLRTQVLDEIRADLKNGKSCRLVSTSLIEVQVWMWIFPVYFARRQAWIQLRCRALQSRGQTQRR